MNQDDEDQLTQYVQKVYEGTRDFGEKVLSENVRLQNLVLTLEREKAELEERARGGASGSGGQDSEREDLRRRVEQVEMENRRLTERFAELEQQNASLLNVYVASYRLHGTLERAEVLDTIQEIVVNLIGSEEFAILQREESGGGLVCARAVNIEAGRLAELTRRGGAVEVVVRTGKPLVAGEGAEAGQPGCPDLTACIPLKVGDDMIGALAIFRLLSHKSGLQAVDRELLSLLGSQAGIALYCTELHSRLAPARA